jgi:hypothetical protein
MAYTSMKDLFPDDENDPLFRIPWPSNTNSSVPTGTFTAKDDVSPDNPAPPPSSGQPDPTTPPAPNTTNRPRYNTTPAWQDPYSAPSYNPSNPGLDPYWNDWIAANPTYRGQGYAGPPATPSNKTVGPQWSDPRQAFEAILRGNPNDPTDASSRINQMFGYKTGNEVYFDKDRNVIVTPWGGYYAGGSNGWQWSPTTPETGGQSGGGLQQSNASAQNNQLMDLLMGLFSRGNALLDKYSQPVTADDPLISNVVNAFHGSSARQEATQREMLAERAHAEGVPTGAFDAAVSNADTQRGLAESSLLANLMNNENVSRRNALNSLFGGETGLLGTGLGSTNANRSLDLSNQQFYDNLAFLMSTYGNNLDSYWASIFGGR